MFDSYRDCKPTTIPTDHPVYFCWYMFVYLTLVNMTNMYASIFFESSCLIYYIDCYFSIKLAASKISKKNLIVGIYRDLQTNNQYIFKKKMNFCSIRTI